MEQTKLWRPSYLLYWKLWGCVPIYSKCYVLKTNCHQSEILSLTILENLKEDRKGSNLQTLYSVLFRMLSGHHLKLLFMPLVTRFMHWVINVRKSVGLNTGKLWVWILAPTLMSSVTLDTLCNLSEPQYVAVVQSLGHWLFATPWTAARQASLAFMDHCLVVAKGLA